MWSYNNVAGDVGLGRVHAGCTHDDAAGRVWATY